MNKHGHADSRACGSRYEATPDHGQERIATPNISSQSEGVILNRSHKWRTCRVSFPPGHLNGLPKRRLLAHYGLQSLRNHWRRHVDVDVKTVKRHSIPPYFSGPDNGPGSQNWTTLTVGRLRSCKPPIGALSRWQSFEHLLCPPEPRSLAPPQVTRHRRLLVQHLLRPFAGFGVAPLGGQQVREIQVRF